MKLSDVHSLNTMVYTDEIPSKHKKRMDIRLNYFENFPIKNFMGNPPSLPSSSQTKKELLQLNGIGYNDLVHMWVRNNFHTHIRKMFEKFLQEESCFDDFYNVNDEYDNEEYV